MNEVLFQQLDEVLTRLKALQLEVRRLTLSPRNYALLEDIESGMSLTDAAAKYGISKPRVWQIIEKQKRREGERTDDA